MNSQDIVSIKKDIVIKLSKKQLKEALSKLIDLASNLHDWKASEKLNELENNYKYMLHYQFEGSEDPERETVYNNILRSLYEYTDDITDELLLVESSSLFYDKWRFYRLSRPVSIREYHDQLKEFSENIALRSLLQDQHSKLHVRDLSVRKERLSSDLFLTVYVSTRATDLDYDDYLFFMQSSEIRNEDKCLMVSALMLNLCHRFDAKKMNLLMGACEATSPLVSQRAIVGLIALLQMYTLRWYYYPECRHRLELLSENQSFKKSVLTIIKQFIRARETEKISKKLTEEIIPEMMRFKSISGKKLNLEDIMSENDFSDKNPEWEKELENSGLAGKLKEYTNLQMEGADVFHSTFASLKNFPFFRELSNWFLPFDSTYSELMDLSPNKNDLLYAAILNSGQMCDSDKYSFALSLMQMPSAQREMMMGQFGAESEQLKEMQKDNFAINPSINEEMISNLYIQNLYRFFKLNPLRNNFFDIFQLKLNFYDKPAIAPLISDAESMKQIAHYCFNKNFFKESLDIYERLSLLVDEDADIYQKMGYCRQMLNNQEGALSFYLRADLIAPNNSWTLKRIAQMYRSLKQPEQSLAYYTKAAQLNTDNLSLEMNIGHCYLDLKEYEKALNCYFKVELLDAKGSKAWRPIAWTAFLLGKLEVSQNYYTKILENKPTVHDYLNAGHVELCIHTLATTKLALTYYKKAIRKEGNMDRFIALFEEDKADVLLIGKHLDENLFPLLFDQLRYELD